MYVLTLNAAPHEGSPLLFNMKTFFNTWCDPYTLVFTVKGEELAAVCTGHRTDADVFRYGEFTSAGHLAMKYAEYIPAEETDRLIVWLHGIGEGVVDHTDPSVTVLANKVTSFASETFQEYVKGAYVFVPQCPTCWMDGDGTGSSSNGGRIEADAHSFYTAALTEMIRHYQDTHKIRKTVIAGCSNGSYMTMLLGINSLDIADGYVPVCEALKDKYINDDDIKTLKDLPMYFVYSKDDPAVIPEEHEIPTLARLKKAGAENIHASVTEHVEDTSGLYKDKDGKPVRCSGHWSWIYLFNNECDADGLKACYFIRGCLT
ncbi:MAG: hypothetical protein IKD69_07515 [Solobacterium sp.]|nr:hypothetical protein [Solobacterium sp.]